MERLRFTDHLEAIKFICKDLWYELFKKQIDNLKTNHRGTYILQDNRFCWLAHMSIDPSPDSESQDNLAGETTASQVTSMYLYFPCGIITGALSNLGIPCAVFAEISNLPACVGFGLLSLIENGSHVHSGSQSYPFMLAGVCTCRRLDACSFLLWRCLESYQNC